MLNKKQKEIWDEFKTRYSNDFEDYMGYGVEEIERIGINKFLTAMDWRSIDDVPKYKTDAIKVIPCCDCGNEFATYQLDYGLCDKCKPKYDLESFENALGAAEKENEGSSYDLIVLFINFGMRNFYAKQRNLETVADLFFFGTVALTDGDFMDNYRDFAKNNFEVVRSDLADIIKQGESSIDEFIEASDKLAEAYSITNTIIEEIYVNIKNILKSDKSPDDKISEVEKFFLKEK